MYQYFKRIERISLFLVLLVISCNSLLATSADPNPFTFTQPNGDTLTIVMRGDEFVKFAVTEDGYTLLYDTNGFYCYAQLNANGDMEPSKYTAKSKDMRTAKENLFLKTIQPGLYFSQSQLSVSSQMHAMRASASSLERAIPTTGNRKLLCILIEFTDIAFSKTDQDFDTLFNVGTGSVRNYFLEASYGQLNLSVDVHGPYKASQGVAYYGANANNQAGEDMRPGELVQEACFLAYNDPNVNFSSYANSNNEIEDIYVIYAGYGENVQCANPNWIWAHASTLSDCIVGGIKIKKYATSSELRGISGENITTIGVICHEFGHSLGAPDFYDTDDGIYTGTGDWDLMASGDKNNGGASPAHPNPRVKVDIYKWAIATELTAPQLVTIPPSINNRMAFYKISTKTPGEHFIIENRQNTQNTIFDKNLPGHGLVIYRCDSCIATFEGANTVNTTHPQRFYPVCASSTFALPRPCLGTYGDINSAGCPFPVNQKDSLTDTSTPSMQSWAGVNTEKPITNISENAAGTITFNFMGGDSIVINAYASDGGTISPSGAIIVQPGSNQTFTFTPDYGAVIDSVWVDGVTVPSAVSIGSYTFSNITESHNIYVFFNYDNFTCPAQTPPLQASYDNLFDCKMFSDCWSNESAFRVVWHIITYGGSPYIPPLSESGMFAFYSASYPIGCSGQLITPKIITNSEDYTASFWMYRDNSGTYGGQNYQDKVNVYFSTTPSIIGLTPVYTVHRCRNLAPVESVDGWYYYSVSIPTIYTNSGYVIFEAVGDDGNMIYVDEFYIDETVPTLKVKPTTLDFNAVNIGTISTSKVITVSGIMTSNFTYSKTGANADDFTITETSWSATKGGILKVTFTPSSSGNKTAEILISSDNTTNQIVTLNGIGLDNSPFYCAGTGTTTDPYQICNANQLAALAAYVNAGNGNTTFGKYFILVNDIDLSGYTAGTGWKPIGGAKSIPISGSGSGSGSGFDFQGNFNGAGQVIRNLTVNRPTENFVGLFGSIYRASIQNLGVENCNINGNYYVGNLVGEMCDHSTVTNCHATGSVNGNSILVGGLVGFNFNYSTITNSYFTGSVTGNSVCVGGLVGRNTDNCSVDSCYATGNVSGDGWLGGLVGENDNSSTITNSHATGSVTGSSSLGGLVGKNDNGSTITNSHASGSVTGSSSLGGLVGENADHCSVDSCYATGNVSGSSYVGGLVGYNTNNSKITNSCATGSVTGSGSQVGGLVGYNTNSSIQNCIVANDSLIITQYTSGINPIEGSNNSITDNNKTDSYTTCNVSGSSNVGGLVGYNENSTINNCHTFICVNGSNNLIGGLVGGNYNSPVNNCHTTGNVTGNAIVGGLVGRTSGNSSIANCYATGSVTGNSNYVGGLAGENNSAITNSYATGSVTGNSNYVGGLVGYNNNSTIQNCIAANDSIIATQNTSYINRIAGSGSSDCTYSNNYAFDGMVLESNDITINRNDDNTCNGTGKPLDTFKTLTFYNMATNWHTAAWDINPPSGVWNICEYATLPFLRWQEISTCPHIITATAGNNGHIRPAGFVAVDEGESQMFTFTPNIGYYIDSVFVDGSYDANAVTNGSYIFANVVENHSIHVTFGIDTYTITTTVIGNGSITPSGEITVNEGEGQVFTFAANYGYHIDSVFVDGNYDADAVMNGSYIFTNVMKNHTIHVIFAINTIDATQSFMLDFESDDIGKIYPGIAWYPEDLTAVVENKPKSNGKALHIINRNWNSYPKFSIIFPEGKTLADVEKITFEIYYESVEPIDGQIPNSWKGFDYFFGTEGASFVPNEATGNTGYIVTDPADNPGKTWLIKEFVPTIEGNLLSLNKFDFGFGLAINEAGNYFLDNITFVLKKGEENIPVSSIDLNKTTITLVVGETEQLTATVTPTNATNKNVAWSSSNTSVTTVDATGLVTAVSAGTAIITVTTQDGNYTATCEVMVTQPVTGISLSKSAVTLTVESTEQLIATIEPSNATNKTVTWSSNNTTIALVSSTGIVTAKDAGTATITVTTQEGNYAASCTITVTQPLSNISPIKSAIKVYPNPVNNEIFIKSELQINKVEICSLTGNLLILENNFNKQISVSTLSKGIYLLNVYTDEGVVVSKIAKN